ncbi:MAG: tetratricopeptide repeat protein [bacterium]|nr:tetratricopeptide repeat protein [bacterium]
MAGGVELVFRLAGLLWVDALETRVNVISIHSPLTGPDEVMATWDATNLHIYIVASLALVLAVPLRDMGRRAGLVGGAAVVVLLVCLAVCTAQIAAVVGTHASSTLGVEVFTAEANAFIEQANRGLVMLGMMAFPALLFLVAYLVARAEDSGGRPTVRLKQVAVAATPFVVVGVLVLTLARAGPTPADASRPGAAWSRVVELNPSFAPGLVNAGHYAAEAGEADVATELYRRALRVAPNLVQAHYNLGRALQVQGLHEEAAASYRRAIELDPAHSGAHRNLGIILLALKRNCEALGHLGESARLSPEYRREARLQEVVSRLEAVCARSRQSTRTPESGSHRRKPPSNARALPPRRVWGGSSSSSLAFPPPRTT